MNSQLRSSRFDKAVMSLSLEWLRSIRPELGLEASGETLQSLAASTLATRGNTEIRGIAADFLAIVEGCLGSSYTPPLLDWFEALWAPLDAQWDWFAYTFALGRWFGGMKYRREDSFSLATNGPVLLDLMEEHYIAPDLRFDRTFTRMTHHPLSEWDQQVLKAAGFRLTAGDDELLDLGISIRTAVSRRHFQQFWSSLRSVPELIQAIDSIRDAVEAAVKAETCFPEHRRLPRPSELIASDWLTLPAAPDIRPGGNGQGVSPQST